MDAPPVALPRRSLDLDAPPVALPRLAQPRRSLDLDWPPPKPAVWRGAGPTVPEPTYTSASAYPPLAPEVVGHDDTEA